MLKKEIQPVLNSTLTTSIDGLDIVIDDFDYTTDIIRGIWRRRGYSVIVALYGCEHKEKGHKPKQSMNLHGGLRSRVPLI